MRRKFVKNRGAHLDTAATVLEALGRQSGLFQSELWKEWRANGFSIEAAVVFKTVASLSVIQQLFATYRNLLRPAGRVIRRHYSAVRRASKLRATFPKPGAEAVALASAARTASLSLNRAKVLLTQRLVLAAAVDMGLGHERLAHPASMRRVPLMWRLLCECTAGGSAYASNLRLARRAVRKARLIRSGKLEAANVAVWTNSPLADSLFRQTKVCRILIHRANGFRTVSRLATELSSALLARTLRRTGETSNSKAASSLRIGSFNAGGIGAGSSNTLADLVEAMRSHRLDALAIQETKYSSAAKSLPTVPAGYHLIQRYRNAESEDAAGRNRTKRTVGGGTAWLVRKGIRWQPTPLRAPDPEVASLEAEWTWLTFSMRKARTCSVRSNELVHCCSVYWSSGHAVDVPKLASQVAELQTTGRVLLVGDFNSDLIAITSGDTSKLGSASVNVNDYKKLMGLLPVTTKNLNLLDARRRCSANGAGGGDLDLDPKVLAKSILFTHRIPSHESALDHALWIPSSASSTAPTLPQSENGTPNDTGSATGDKSLPSLNICDIGTSLERGHRLLIVRVPGAPVDDSTGTQKLNIRYRLRLLRNIKFKTLFQKELQAELVRLSSMLADNDPSATARAAGTGAGSLDGEQNSDSCQCTRCHRRVCCCFGSTVSTVEPLAESQQVDSSHSPSPDSDSLGSAAQPSVADAGAFSAHPEITLEMMTEAIKTALTRSVGCSKANTAQGGCGGPRWWNRTLTTLFRSRAKLARETEHLEAKARFSESQHRIGQAKHLWKRHHVVLQQWRSTAKAFRRECRAAKRTEWRFAVQRFTGFCPSILESEDDRRESNDPPSEQQLAAAELAYSEALAEGRRLNNNGGGEHDPVQAAMRSVLPAVWNIARLQKANSRAARVSRAIWPPRLGRVLADPVLTRNVWRNVWRPKPHAGLNEIRTRVLETISPEIPGAWLWGQRRHDAAVAVGGGVTELDDDEKLVMSITAAEVRAAARMLSNGKAPGSDGVPNEALRALPDVAFAQLAECFNKCAREEQEVPESFVEGLVRLIPKPGSNLNNPLSYRPITLLSHVRKLFETVIWRRVRPWAEARGLLAEEQAGFRSGRGCMQQALLLHTLQQNQRAQKRPLYAVFLDVTKAFDTAPHEAILHKAVARGIPLPMVRVLWLLMRGLRSRLLDVAAAAAAGGDGSDGVCEDGLSPADFFELLCGLPQGGVVSPFFWDLFYDDFVSDEDIRSMGPKLTMELRIGMLAYADDASTLAETIEDIRRQLAICEKWSSDWNIKFNPAKSYAVVLAEDPARSAAEVMRDEVLTLYGAPLKWERAVLYLGVPIGMTNEDCLQLWQKARLEKAKADWDSLDCFTDPVSGLPTRCGSELYMRSIRTALLYGAAVLPFKLPDKAEKFQRAAARRILHTYDRTHTFSNYQVLGFSRIHTYVELLMVQLAASIACGPVELYREVLRVQLHKVLPWGWRLASALQRLGLYDEFADLMAGNSGLAGQDVSAKENARQLLEFKSLLHSRHAEKEIEWQAKEQFAKQLPYVPSLISPSQQLSALLPTTSSTKLGVDSLCYAKMTTQTIRTALASDGSGGEKTLYAKLRPVEFLRRVHRYAHIGYLFSLPRFSPLDTKAPAVCSVCRRKPTSFLRGEVVAIDKHPLNNGDCPLHLLRDCPGPVAPPAVASSPPVPNSAAGSDDAAVDDDVVTVVSKSASKNVTMDGVASPRPRRVARSAGSSSSSVSRPSLEPPLVSRYFGDKRINERFQAIIREREPALWRVLISPQSVAAREEWAKVNAVDALALARQQIASEDRQAQLIKAQSQPQPPFDSALLKKRADWAKRLQSARQKIVAAVRRDLASERRKEPIAFAGDVVDALRACGIITVGAESVLFEGVGVQLGDPLGTGVDSNGNTRSLAFETIDEVLYQLRKIYYFYKVTRTEVDRLDYGADVNS